MPNAPRLDPPLPSDHRTAGVGAFGCCVALLVAVACSSSPRGGHDAPPSKAATPAAGPGVPAGVKDYDSWDRLMSTEFYHVQGTFIGELTKDPAATDFQMIGDTSRRSAYYFGLFFDENSKLYSDPKEEPEHHAAARKAQAWFLELATAADRKDQQALVQLMGRRKAICTQCHVDLVE